MDRFEVLIRMTDYTILFFIIKAIIIIFIKPSITVGVPLASVRLSAESDLPIDRFSKGAACLVPSNYSTMLRMPSSG
jgi:hypothetical protein